MVGMVSSNSSHTFLGPISIFDSRNQHDASMDKKTTTQVVAEVGGVFHTGLVLYHVGHRADREASYGSLPQDVCA